MGTEPDEREGPEALVIKAEGNEMGGIDRWRNRKNKRTAGRIPARFLASIAGPSDYQAGHRLRAILSRTQPCNPYQLRRSPGRRRAPVRTRGVKRPIQDG